MHDPEQNVGKIYRAYVKYFDTKDRRMKTKSRPVLIVGFEDDYDSPMNIDYEVLSFSSMKRRKPNPIYDVSLDGKYEKFGLNESCYIRTNKIEWIHVKHMEIEDPIGELRSIDPELFETALKLNEQWVVRRTRNHLVQPTNTEV
ncbi:hypothetical protein [Virgibacillus salexigens]|uniref:hypothetical protein n=1 Tax=Virgibacillus salexigens TaxID=61016 RepID=UPI001909A39A|nr:hypothetical protein [Virgibacillus salexigens]